LNLIDRITLFIQTAVIESIRIILNIVDIDDEFYFIGGLLSVDTPISVLESLAQSTIVSQFQTDGCQFLIVRVDHNLEPCIPSILPTKSCIQLGNFEVQGQRCVIIKIQQDSRLSISDITNLLTDRELQIVALVATGCPNKQIANRLRISEWTVSTHLRRIFIKLGVESRAAMVYSCANALKQVSQQLEATMPQTP
jgi:DNA-binding CsgD family transcriptional regulator